MWFHSLLASWKSGLSRSRRPQPRPARRGARLVLERLEDRTLLSSYTALTAADLIADINAANAAGGANTIMLAAKTHSPYVLTAGNNYADGATGLPVIAANDNLTILGNGDTIERSTASGTVAFRLFDVAAGASLTLQNLKLQNGLAWGATGLVAATAAEGGAVYNQGTLDLNGVTVQGNIAQGVTGQVIGFTVIPAGPAAGGGIYSGGALTLAGTTVQNNQALGGTGSSLGGDFGEAGGDGLGGGVCVAGGTATLTNDTFSSNVAQGGQGGAAYSAPGNGGNGFGGALEVSGGTVSLTSSTVSRNTAQGGALGTSQIGGLGETHAGEGEGGGLYIASGATVYLDSFTVKNTKGNHADLDPNIDGTYILR
ncbi:MAG TPA: hypothetical protein DDY78_20955 [Planctomycetales bacterium]|jgi:hypothetical protein|nr:hypothetical protein [Planctomycetales bacterium]